MIRNLFLTIVLFSVMGLTAQNTDKKLDVLHMNNGDTHEGIIIKNELGIIDLLQTDSLKRQTTRQFQLYSIKRIEHNKSQTVEGGGAKSTLSTQQPSTTISNTGQAQTINPVYAENELNPILSQMQGNITLNPRNTEFQQHSLSPTWGLSKSTGLDIDPFAPIRPKRVPRKWTRDIRGLHGFIDYGYNLGVGKHRNNGLEIASSIGFQFNPIIYLGVGTSYKISANKASSLPIFINPRINMLDNEDVVPYWDVRAGYSPLSTKGIYFSTSVGSSFIFGKKGRFAANVGLVYSYQDARYNQDDHVIEAQVKMKEKQHTIGLKITFEAKLTK